MGMTQDPLLLPAQAGWRVALRRDRGLRAAPFRARLPRRTVRNAQLLPTPPVGVAASTFANEVLGELALACLLFIWTSLLPDL
jgi:hypothetical protein